MAFESLPAAKFYKLERSFIPEGLQGERELKEALSGVQPRSATIRHSYDTRSPDIFNLILK